VAVRAENAKKIVYLMLIEKKNDKRQESRIYYLARGIFLPNQGFFAACLGKFFFLPREIIFPN